MVESDAQNHQPRTHFPFASLARLPRGTGTPHCAQCELPMVRPFPLATSRDPVQYLEQLHLRRLVLGIPIDDTGALLAQT